MEWAIPLPFFFSEACKTFVHIDFSLNPPPPSKEMELMEFNIDTHPRNYQVDSSFLL